MAATILPERCPLCKNKEPLDVTIPRRMDLLDDLTGQTFTHLTVQHFVGIALNRNAYWCCLCVCTQGAVVFGGNLRRKKTKSCGCLSDTMRAAKLRTHGMTGTPEYRAWADMIRRCHEPTMPNYKNYGERGIGVCEEWLASFEAFFADMGPRPDSAGDKRRSATYSIERVDNELGYSKDNCIWALPKVQLSNKRTNHLITWGNETHTLSQWCEITGLENMTLFLRLKRGWSIERALTTPSVIPRKQRSL